MYTPDELVERLEFGSEPLTEEERQAVQQFYNGRALQQIVIMPGWQVLLSTLAAKKDLATEELKKVLPGDPRVVAAHAAWHAAISVLEDIEYEVNAAIEYSKIPPEVLRARFTQ